MLKISLSKSFLRKITIFGVMLLIFLVLSILSKEFLTSTNMNNVSRQVTLVIIAGFGVTLLMISGKLDLSIGSTLALSGVLTAFFVSKGMKFIPAMIIVLIAGGLVGAINSILIVFANITPVIATMGTMYMVRGLTFIICDGNTIINGIPRSFSILGTGQIGGVSYQLFIMIAFTIVFVFIEKKTTLGKYSFAIGGNRNAAILSGINVKKIESSLYIVTGVLAALAGIILASRLGVGQPNVGTGFEFDVIVAVVLGGTSLAGGEGSVVGMIIGALIVGFLGNGLNLLGVQSFYQYVFKGAVLVGAVLLDNLLVKKLSNK